MQWVTGRDGYDEVFDRPGRPRAHYRSLVAQLRGFTPAELTRRERLQRLSLMNQGITFTVYGEKEGIDRIFPFDFVPRVVTVSGQSGSPGCMSAVRSSEARLAFTRAANAGRSAAGPDQYRSFTLVAGRPMDTRAAVPPCGCSSTRSSPSPRTARAVI